MPSCAFRKCNNNSKNSNKAKGITFHVFPQEPGIKEKWIKIIQEEQRDDEWLPTKYSRICSAHFNGDMFNMTQAGLRNLKHFAIPSFKTPGMLRQSLPAPKGAAEPAPRTGRPRCVEPLAPAAPLQRSPVRPRGSALPCEIKVTSGPSTVLRKSQINPEFNPVITGIKSEADPVKQEGDPHSVDTLSLAEDTDQLSNADQPSEDLIALSNAQDPLSNAPDPLSDVKVEELEIGVKPEEVNRSVELTRLPLHLRQELLRAGNDCYNLIRIQANQINKLSIRCGKQRQKLNSYMQLARRRNKKVSELQAEVVALRNFITEHGWEATSVGRGKLTAPRIQLQSSDTSVVEKKNNRQLLIVKRNNNRPRSLVSARHTSHKQTSDNIQKSLLDALHTSDNRQKSAVGVKRTLNIHEKPSVGIPDTSDVLQKSTIGIKRASVIPRTSLIGLQRTSNDNIQQSSDSVKPTSEHLQKSPVGCPSTIGVRQKSSVTVKRTSEIINKPSVVAQRMLEVGQNPSVVVQPISDIPQTPGGLQRTPDMRQNALVIQIDGMHNTVLQPKLVRLEDSGMETG